MPTGLGDEQLWISATNDNTGSSTAFDDQSGNGNDGTASGTTVVADTGDGGTYAFDSSSAGYVIECAYQGTDSISCWIYTSLADRFQGTSFFTGTNAYASSGWGDAMYYATTNTYVKRGNSGGSFVLLPSSTPSGTWYHYASVRTASGMSYYIDGVEVATGITSSQDRGNLFIGCAAGAGAIAGVHRLDDFRAYTRELTQAEITHLATSRGIEGSPFTGLGDEKLWISATNDNTGSSTAFQDQSGNSNAGTPVGGMLVVADTNEGGTYAFNLDGVDDQITLSSLNNWNDGTAFSFSLWSVASATGSRWYPYRAAGSGANREYYSYYGSAGLLHRASNGSGNSGNQSSGISAGTWFHAVVTYDGTTLRLFLDGVEIDSYTPSPLSAATSLVIGQNTTTTAKMDDIRSYNRAITQTEITHLASARGVEGSPYVGLGDEKLWLCPSLNNSPADISGNGNDGTYVGGLATTADTGSGGSLAYEIDVNSKGVTLPSNMIGGLTEYSMSIWAKLTQVPSSTGSLFGAYASATTNANLSFLTLSGGLQVYGITDTGSTSSVVYENPATAGNWRHLTYTYKQGEGTTVYEDGVEVGSLSSSLIFTGKSVLTFSIGKGSLNGTICLTDDARIYHRKITQAEITHLATSRGIEGSPSAPTAQYNAFLTHAFKQLFQTRLR